MVDLPHRLSSSFSPATKWLHRQNAIQAIASFISDRETPSTHEALERDTTCILVLVKQHTRGFNETNVQVSKSIMELFIAICDCHEEQGYPVPTWVALEATNLGCSKIADKKLSPMSKSLLLSTCVVAGPRVVTQQAYETMVAIKSPIAHEEFLKWMKTFAEEFGSGSLGAGLKNAVAFLCKVGENRFGCWFASINIYRSFSHGGLVSFIRNVNQQILR